MVALGVVFGVGHFLALVGIGELLPGVDSLARVLGRVLRSGIHRRRLEHRLQLLATAGRRGYWLDVCDLGRDITSAQGSWPLRHSGRAILSRRVAESIAVALWGGLWAQARNAEAQENDVSEVADGIFRATWGETARAQQAAPLHPEVRFEFSCWPFR
jgi:hypothetical protein